MKISRQLIMVVSIWTLAACGQEDLPVDQAAEESTPAVGQVSQSTSQPLQNQQIENEIVQTSADAEVVVVSNEDMASDEALEEEEVVNVVHGDGSEPLTENDQEDLNTPADDQVIFDLNASGEDETGHFTSAEETATEEDEDSTDQTETEDTDDNDLEDPPVDEPSDEEDQGTDTDPQETPDESDDDQVDLEPVEPVDLENQLTFSFEVALDPDHKGKINLISLNGDRGTIAKLSIKEGRIEFHFFSKADKKLYKLYSTAEIPRGEVLQIDVTIDENIVTIFVDDEIYAEFEFLQPLELETCTKGLSVGKKTKTAKESTKRRQDHKAKAKLYKLAISKKK